MHINNHLGTITLTKRYFYELIGGAVSNCFGVADTNAGNWFQSFAGFLSDKLPFLKETIPSGVELRFNDGQLTVNLHITVLYGVNAASLVKSIQHKVRYVIEEETDIRVAKINVFIDGIRA